MRPVDPSTGCAFWLCYVQVCVPATHRPDVASCYTLACLPPIHRPEVFVFLVFEALRVELDFRYFDVRHAAPVISVCALGLATDDLRKYSCIREIYYSCTTIRHILRNVEKWIFSSLLLGSNYTHHKSHPITTAPCKVQYCG